MLPVNIHGPLCYVAVGSMNVELEGQKCNKAGLREVNKINESCDC